MQNYHEEFDSFNFYESQKLTPDTFNESDLLQRVLHIIKLGKYLGTTVQPAHYVHYYQLDEFFACLFYSIEEDKVTDCDAFDDADKLDPLWDQLDIDAFVLKKE